jgi:hypothetical protein
MAAPTEVQAEGPKAGERVFEAPRNMTLLNMRTAAHSAESRSWFLLVHGFFGSSSRMLTSGCSGRLRRPATLRGPASSAATVGHLI